MSLFDTVADALGSPDNVDVLAAASGIERPEQVARASLLTATVVLTRMLDVASDRRQVTGLIRGLDAAGGLGAVDPIRIVPGEYERLGEAMADLLGKRSVIRAAAESGVSPTGAAGLVSPVSWLLARAMAIHHDGPFGRATLATYLEQEQEAMLEREWDVWLATVSPAVAERRVAAPAPTHRSGEARPSPEAVIAPARPARVAAPPLQPPAESRPTSPVRRHPEPGRNQGLVIPLMVVALLGLGGALVWALTRDTADETVASSGSEADETSGAVGASEDASVSTTVTTAVTTVPSTTAAVASDEEPGPPTDPVGAIEVNVALVDEAGGSAATGSAELTFDRSTNQICHRFDASGIGEPFDGHLHVGQAGEEGGILVDFGPLDADRLTCTPVSSAVMQVIVSGGSGHYVELHDSARSRAVRAQLPLDGISAATTSPANRFDPDGGGAVALARPGQVALVGAVPDQFFVDVLVGELSVLEGSEIEVTNSLTVDAAAPLPTGGIIIDQTGLFGIGSATISDDGAEIVGQLADLFLRRPDWTITIIGHTDSTGDQAGNLDLSLRRAETVRDLLVDGGVAAGRLRVDGVGDPDPIGDNATAEGRAQNRRVEIEITRR